MPEILYDCEAEYFLLAFGFFNNENFNAVCVDFNADDFYDTRHKTIFYAFKKLYKDNLSANCDSVRMVLGNDLEAAGGDVYLSQIASQYPSLDIEYLHKSLKQKSKRRQIINFGMNVMSGAKSEENFDRMMSNFSNMSQKIFDDTSDNGTIFSFAELIKKVNPYQKAVDAQTAHNEGKPISEWISSGYADIDRVLQGFSNSRLYIIGARPGAGKSTLMLNLANNMQDKKIFIFSLEMSAEELLLKVILMNSKIDLQSYKKGLIKASDIQEIYGVTNKLKDNILYIDEMPAIRPFEILSRARKVKNSVGLDILFIDYLQLMRGNDAKYESNEVKVASISRDLKGIAKILNIPVVALAQLNRKVEERTNKMPVISDLRESGSLEADADAIMLLSPDENDSTALRVNIDKNRFGPTEMVKLYWDKKLSRIENHTYEQPKSIYL